MPAECGFGVGRDAVGQFARRLAARTDIHLLTGCGHFPVEQPGVDELAEHLRALAADLVGTA